MKRPFFLLIKPASYLCNLHCDYCFYLCKEEIYHKTSNLKMSDEVLKRVIKSYMKTDQIQYNICWQGGEPMVMGLSFYQQVIEYEKQFAYNNSIIANALQTNATLLDDEWSAFLEKYHFLVGVSLDGDAQTHDKYRRTIDDQGTHEKVIKAIELLNKYHVDHNLLVLVNSSNVDKPETLYTYLKKQKTPYLQFTPCVEFDKNGNLMPYAITGKQWGRFLCDIFDLWIKEDVGKIFIRQFDAVLENMYYGNCSMCTMNNNCSQYFVVEHNGDVYPCDFFVEEKKKLGNIMENTWEELLQKKAFLDFGDMKSNYHISCAMCSYVDYCQGDCLKNRYYHTEESDNLSWLCDGWKMFYQHTLPIFRQFVRRT